MYAYGITVAESLCVQEADDGGMSMHEERMEVVKIRQVPCFGTEC